MGRRPKWGRPIDGVLLLDKDQGMTSNDALQKAKRLYFANKAGHTGSLDPLATGVLPICFGESTKFSQFLLDADKRYESTFRLGMTTDTSDADGETLTEIDARSVTREQVETALEQFRGDITQIPSMYSALKHNGQPLYKLARQGIEVERQPRSVTVYELKLLDFRPGHAAEVDVEVHCSKGTYIRSIAEDLGHELGCGAHVKHLHRTEAGPFMIEDCFSLEELEQERGEELAEVLDQHLLAVDAPISHWPEIELPNESAFYFSQGNPVMDARAFTLGDVGDMVRVFGDNDQFLGVGELDNDGNIAPKRLVAQKQPPKPTAS